LRPKKGIGQKTNYGGERLVLKNRNRGLNGWIIDDLGHWEGGKVCNQKERQLRNADIKELTSGNHITVKKGMVGGKALICWAKTSPLGRKEMGEGVGNHGKKKRPSSWWVGKSISPKGALGNIHEGKGSERR